MLRLRCLGSFQLNIDKQEVTLPTRKTAALLAYLTLHPEVHAREQVVARFWGDFGEEEARRSLRTALSALRKTLGDACLLADRETVQFNPAYPIWIDVVALRQQQTVAPNQIDLSLYRGDFLAGFYDEWVLREREELRHLYLQLLLRQAQHWRTQGDYAQTIATAQRILAFDPAEETAHQHLLFCYMVAGDRQAARQQYEACVRALRDELDVAPAPETVALYRRSQQAHSPMRATTAAQSNLPLPLSSFIGRTPEIANLHTLLVGNRTNGGQTPARLVTIAGPGGCGKTRLAIQVAREVLDHFADGVWWVELAALRDDSQAPQALAKVLDVQQGAQSSLIEVLITHLRAKQALVVLDNCEHLLAACAELAEQLLRHCPHLQILATSRETLGIFGETSWLAPSLTVPAAPLAAVADYLQFEAIHLFVERAAAVHRAFTLTPANAPAILQICRQLDGIPLAIELAAVRIKLMTVEQLAVRLTGVTGAPFELLTEGSRTVLPRQQTLRATIEWSYALLSEQEQRLLQQFSIFAGSWSLDAAEATGTASGQQPVATVLARLVDKSLVLVESQGEVARYRMLETVRQYAYEQLEKTGAADAVRERHLTYFLHLAEQAEPQLRSADQLTWLRRLDAEYENLRTALVWSLQQQSQENQRLFQGVALAAALTDYWHLHSHYAEGRYWLQTSVHMVEGYLLPLGEQPFGVTSLGAKALYGAGLLAWSQNKFDEARQLFDASAELWRVVGDDNGVFRTQIYQAQLLSQQINNVTTAYKLWHECLAYFRQTQNVFGMAETLVFLEIAERVAGNFVVARRYVEESVMLLQTLGERWLLSLALSHLGLLDLAQGHYTTAQLQFDQRLALGREFGLKQPMIAGMNFSVELAYKQGDFRRAARLAREALTLARQVGHDPAASLIGRDQLAVIALVCVLDGQNQRAAKLLAARQPLIARYAFGGWKLESTRYEQLLAELHTHLDEAAFAKAWAEGIRLTPEQALEQALLEE